ncbi:RagB/SusD family nutrient uptake outer membrane protein [Sphingobacterium oryzagri]|uniref:RagB/SusD family nutrient uptake outer membrane protein n=1 Tax=Sphingobacterium oryzagri TaxID=3025669 RepID=A0ABY7WG25_9SPHI|nr:RagB/SusD family nutrient uptake outer membrane protein [Sphingobacterium sp. KACC 22765]WDF67333.1 RagB/SusD family nutrient uptake outer membrane protein [Sphingobacterium sp. KACC 22765]
MKKILITLSIATGALFFSGCEKFLDRPALGQENLDTYYQTEEEVLKQIAGCYQGIFWDDWWQVAQFYPATDMATDDMWMNNTTQSQAAYIRMAHYQNPNQDDLLKNYWQYRYKAILRSNVVLDRMPQSPITNENLRARVIAEARFLRAFQYFELVKNFGGVPLVTEMLMPEEIQGVTRNTLEECYAFIEEDLRAAAEVLPARSAYAAADLGRATRDAARAYLGKVYLYQNKMAEAESILGQVIASGEYDLLDNFDKVWTIANNNSIESLFEVQYSDVTGYNLGGRLPVVTGSRDDSGWSWSGPTSDLENAFLAAGDNIRLRSTIIKHGDDVWNDASESAQNFVIDPAKHKSARINRKFYIPHAERAVPYDANRNKLNHRLLRFADVLLMYAEAANATGKDSEARTALNRVRDRVDLPAINASGNALRQAIRNERRLELALEHQRLYDIRRWDDTNGKKVIANLFGPSGSFVLYNTVTSSDPYERPNQQENSNKGTSFVENRDLLFPIPNSEIILSEGTLVQNPNF